MQLLIKAKQGSDIESNCGEKTFIKKFVKENIFAPN